MYKIIYSCTLNNNKKKIQYLPFHMNDYNKIVDDQILTGRCLNCLNTSICCHTKLSEVPS